MLEAGDAAHKTLEPGPYWPETGHAQITCSEAAVVFAAADDSRDRTRPILSWRWTRELSDPARGSAGIAPSCAAGGPPRYEGGQFTACSDQSYEALQNNVSDSVWLTELKLAVWIISVGYGVSAKRGAAVAARVSGTFWWGEKHMSQSDRKGILEKYLGG